jgi:hypothetical protein
MNKEKSKDSLDKFDQRHSENKYIPNSYQENRGKRWSSEEDMYLLQQVSFMTHTDIGKHLRRSENAVGSRLKKLAFHMIQNGEDPLVVQNNLKLSSEDIEQINNECFIYTRKNTGKFITSVKKPGVKKGYFASQPSQEMQVLLEIRTMIRKMLYFFQGQQETPRNRSSKEISSSIRITDLNMEDLEKHSEEFAKSIQI